MKYSDLSEAPRGSVTAQSGDHRMTTTLGTTTLRSTQPIGHQDADTQMMCPSRRVRDSSSRMERRCDRATETEHAGQLTTTRG
eukprot:4912011-Alexandrium_andersonii.AAC.1